MAREERSRARIIGKTIRHQMRARTGLGKAWIVHSEDTSTSTRKLVSILSARRTIGYVRTYVEQRYVDEFASIEEKIAYKKDSLRWPYPAEILEPAPVICCGFGPFYWAHYCHSLKVDGDVLVAKCRFIKSVDADLRPIEFTEKELRIHFA